MNVNVVPVLLYHSVTDDPAPWIAPFTVPPRVFAEQLDRIADAGLTVVPLHRLAVALRGGPPLPPHSAVLTFDDGFADFYWSVAPMLTHRELPATLYVTTGAVHTPGDGVGHSLLPPAAMLTWRQIGILDACGFDVGGHTRTHAQLDTLAGRRVCDEVAGCKQDLEQVLGHAVTAFAYPHGYSSAAVRRKVQHAGWASATGVGNALSSAVDHPLRISRLMLRADTPAELFQAWLSGTGAPVAPRPEQLRTKGWRAYRRFRARLGRPVGGPPTA